MLLPQIGSWTFIGSFFAWVAVWAFFPSAWNQSWPSYVFPALGLIGFIVWLVFSLEKLKLWLKRRSTQFGLGMITMAVMSVFVLGFVNWVAVRLTESKDLKKDFTASQLHSLSGQTLRILGKLPEEVLVRVWSTGIDRMAPNLDMDAFLKNYERAAGGKLKVEIRNPNEFRPEAEQDEIRRDNVIVIRGTVSGRSTRIESFSDSKGEEQLTNAIVQATKGTKKIVCFVAGHGEPQIDNAGPQGMNLLKENLEKSSYEVREIVLGSTPKIPDDCELLALVGPRNPPVPRELEMIKGHLALGGKLIALIGPRAPAPWRDLFADYGVKVRQDLMVDPMQEQNPIWIVTRNYSNGVSVVDGFRVFTLFPETASIQLPEKAPGEGLSVRTFVSSERDTYSKRGDLKSIRSLVRTPGDMRGPMPFGVLISRRPPGAKGAAPAAGEEGDGHDHGNELEEMPPMEGGESGAWKLPELVPSAHAQEGAPRLPPPGPGLKALPAAQPTGQAKDENPIVKTKEMDIVLLGNDAFVLNGFVREAGNMDLFLNSVSYLLKDEELIGIRPREIRQTFLQIGPQDVRKVWGVILILAGLFLVFGIRASRRKAELA
jgi:hypothetical protein